MAVRSWSNKYTTFCMKYDRYKPNEFKSKQKYTSADRTDFYRTHHEWDLGAAIVEGGGLDQMLEDFQENIGGDLYVTRVHPVGWTSGVLEELVEHVLQGRWPISVTEDLHLQQTPLGFCQMTQFTCLLSFTPVLACAAYRILKYDWCSYTLVYVLKFLFVQITW